MEKNTNQTYIEVSTPSGVYKVIATGPFDEGPISVEDLLQLLSDKTKVAIETRLRQCYIDPNTCDYPILPQFFAALYKKLKKIKRISVLYKELLSNGLLLAKKLGFVDKKGRITVPSYQNLWLFIKRRLDERTIDELSDIILKEINEKTQRFGMEFGSRVAHDGVVVRSHDKDAKYNPHYETTMYKAEIGADIDTLIPIYGLATHGTDYDGDYAVPFAEKLDKIEKKKRIGYFDGHYPSLKNFAILNHVHKIRTIMNIPEDQRVISKTGKSKNIDRIYQKLHTDKNFVTDAEINTKLDLLLEHGRCDEVGYYYRNWYVKSFKRDRKEYGSRSLEETVNNCIKNGLVDIENACNGTGMKNRDHHVRLCILSVQIVALIRLQHNITTDLTSVENIAC